MNLAFKSQTANLLAENKAVTAADDLKIVEGFKPLPYYYEGAKFAYFSKAITVLTSVAAVALFSGVFGGYAGVFFAVILIVLEYGKYLTGYYISRRFFLLRTIAWEYIIGFVFCFAATVFLSQYKNSLETEATYKEITSRKDDQLTEPQKVIAETLKSLKRGANGRFVEYGDNKRAKILEAQFLELEAKKDTSNQVTAKRTIAFLSAQSKSQFWFWLICMLNDLVTVLASCFIGYYNSRSYLELFGKNETPTTTTQQKQPVLTVLTAPNGRFVVPDGSQKYVFVRDGDNKPFDQNTARNYTNTYKNRNGTKNNELFLYYLNIFTELKRLNS